MSFGLQLNIIVEVIELLDRAVKQSIFDAGAVRIAGVKHKNQNDDDCHNQQDVFDEILPTVMLQSPVIFDIISHILIITHILFIDNIPHRHRLVDF